MYENFLIFFLIQYLPSYFLNNFFHIKIKLWGYATLFIDTVKSFLLFNFHPAAQKGSGVLSYHERAGRQASHHR